jgi:carbamoylphosphate synthase large subunit
VTPKEYSQFISTISKAAFGLGQASSFASDVREVVAGMERKNNLSPEEKVYLEDLKVFLGWYRDGLKVVRLDEEQGGV